MRADKQHFEHLLWACYKTEKKTFRQKSAINLVYSEKDVPLLLSLRFPV